MKKLPFLKYGWIAVPWLFFAAMAGAYGGLSYISLNSPGTGVSELRHTSLTYATIDERRQLNFQTPYEAILQIDSKSMSVPYRVVGYDWISEYCSRVH